MSTATNADQADLFGTFVVPELHAPVFSKDWSEPPAPDFDGETYDRPRDHTRLASALVRVQGVMSDGEWHTLAELSARLQLPEPGISARLRDLRKPKFGGHTVERRHVAGGLWEYRYTAADHA